MSRPKSREQMRMPAEDRAVKEIADRDDRLRSMNQECGSGTFPDEHIAQRIPARGYSKPEQAATRGQNAIDDTAKTRECELDGSSDDRHDSRAEQRCMVNGQPRRQDIWNQPPGLCHQRHG